MHSQNDESNRTGMRWVMLWFVLFLLGVGSYQPPRLPAEDATDPGALSAVRALDHVASLSSSPRFVGMPGHRQARAHLRSALEEHGWVVEEQSGIVFNRWWGAQVTNLVAHLPSDSTAPAVLLVSHYDTVPTGPGAGDAASAVGALLEVARVLSVNPPAHPVRLLLTDGEELGLLGARHFVAEGGLRGVGAVVNLEARGGGGAAMLFESHESNASFVDAFARSPAPVGTSLSTEVYRRMPNDTDFTVLQQAGVAGLNFAFIERFHHYHSALDTVAGLDRRSVYHHGVNALALARGLGGLSADPPGQTRIYFTLPGRVLARYPAVWALPLSALSGLLLLLLLAGRRSMTAMARGAGGSVLVVGVAGLAGACAGGAVLMGLPELSETRVPLPYRPMLWMMGLMLLSGGTALALLRQRSERWDPQGGVLLWLVLAVLVAWTAPGASYLFFWPVLVAGVFCRHRGLSAGLSAATGWMLIGPLLGVLFHALGLVAAGPAGVLIGALVVLSGPAMSNRMRRRASRLLLLAATVILGVAGLRSGTDAAHPRYEGWVYQEDADQASAMLYTWQPDEEGPAVLEHPLARGGLTAVPVEAIGALGAALQVHDGPARLGRSIQIQVQTAEPASMLRLTVPNPERVRAVMLDGAPVPVSSVPTGRWLFFADLKAGVQVDIDLNGSAPLDMDIEVGAFGRARVSGAHQPGRMPTPWLMGVTDMILVTQRRQL